MTTAQETPTVPAPPSLWSPLAHRDFALLWAGFIVSHIGDSVQMHAQAWLVVDQLHAAGLRVGGVALAQAIPRLLLGLFAGVLVDRINRRAMLFITQGLAMAQSVAFLLLLRSGHITYAWVVVLAALLGVFDTLNLNARLSMMPTLVPRPLIGRAVALQALGVNVVQIAGPALAGLLIGQFGVAGCLVANIVSFVVLFAALAAMRTSGAVQGKDLDAKGFGGELREGFAFVRARPLLWGSIALAYLLGMFGVSIARLLALYARVVVGTDARGYGFLALATGLGAIVASVLVTARARAVQLPRNIVAGALGFSCAVGALGFVHTYPAAFAGIAAVGFGQMAFRSAITTSIQLETPDRLRGRVISLLTLDFSLWSIGAVLAGAAADRFALARARTMPGLANTTLSPSHLPRAAQAWGLSATLLAMGIVCLACTALLARTILRGRVSSAAERVVPP